MTEEAVAEYRKAISLDPGRAEPHNHLGVLHLSKGRVEEAISHLNKAISLNPNDGEPHYNLAMAYYRKKDLRRASKYAEKAVQLGYSVNPKFLQLLSPRP